MKFIVILIKNITAVEPVRQSDFILFSIFALCAFCGTFPWYYAAGAVALVTVLNFIGRDVKSE